MVIQNEYGEALVHHGIIGQKWYIRRYQNPDGSLTPLGKKRYAKNSRFRKKIDGEIKKMKEANETPEEKHARLLKSNNANELYKNVDMLSTAEIKERVDRLRAEGELAKYVKHEPTKLEKVTKAVNDVTEITDGAIKFTQSPTGKLLIKQVKKQLNIKNPKMDYKKMLDEIDEMTNDEVKNLSERLKNENKVRSSINEILNTYNKNSNGNGNPNPTQADIDKILKAIDDINSKLDNIT